MMRLNTDRLFVMQRELDERIESVHHLEETDLSDEKLLALQVEVGELANETRCFKFWSVKPPSDRTVILEEYVDGLHFILSIGLSFGFRPTQVAQPGKEEGLVQSFLNVFAAIATFRHKSDETHYSELFSAYMALGEALDFSAEEIQSAYEDKNQVNHVRQDSGY